MKADDVSRCLDETSGIEGWLFPVDALLLGAIDEMQCRLGIAGNLFEIGVHHGKSAILLARMLRADELLGVCDVFGQQELNLDHSGEGSRELFERNMAAFAPSATARTRIHSKRSETLTVDDTTAACRLIHIDGGHRPGDVAADLEIACKALLPEGVVVLDDVFNPSWPGVGEGLYEFVRSAPHRLAPIIIGGNKAAFVFPAAVAKYGESLDRLEAGEFFRHSGFAFERKEWLGRPVLTASRRDWVDLHPLEAARLHLPRQTWWQALLLRFFG